MVFVFKFCEAFFEYLILKPLEYCSIFVGLLLEFAGPPLGAVGNFPLSLIFYSNQMTKHISWKVNLFSLKIFSNKKICYAKRMEPKTKNYTSKPIENVLESIHKSQGLLNLLHNYLFCTSLPEWWWAYFLKVGVVIRWVSGLDCDKMRACHS